jgi:hypothetical protein
MLGAATSSDPDAYLDAFMNGFEFVLLAMRGRLQEAGLDEQERARIETFLADYARIVNAYRARHAGAAAPERNTPFVAELTALASN